MSHRTLAALISVVALLAGFLFIGNAGRGLQAQVIKPEGTTKLLIDFEDASIWSSENKSPFETRSQQVSEGKKSLWVHFTNDPTWSNIWTNKVAGDFGEFKYLNIDIYLEGEVPAGFAAWIRDTQLHKAEDAWQLAPGWNTITMDLEAMRRKAGLDKSAIESMCLYKDVKEEITVHIDNMYLSMEKPVPPKTEPVQMPSSELLINGDFEVLAPAPATAQPIDAVVSPFKGWTAKRWQGASFLGVGQKAVFSQSHSLMLDGRGACKIGLYTDPIKVQSPTKLKLTLFVAGDDLKPGLYGQTAAITVTDHGERGLPGAEIKLERGSFGWKRAELYFDVPPKTPIVKVFIQLMGSGRMWVDSVSLTGAKLDTNSGLTWSDTNKKVTPDAPIVTESPQLLAKVAKAKEGLKALEAAVTAAKAKGIETLYDEIPLMLGKLAFETRWDLPDHLVLRDGYVDYLTTRATQCITHLADVQASRAPDLKVPPHPDFSKLKLDGPYYTLDGQPKILFAMQYHNGGELIKWFTPIEHQGDVPAVGATRYDFKQMPVWEVYQKDPTSHRIYDNGWCGHIIRDQYSAGGEDMCVISLDSPAMREAITKSIKIYCDRLKSSRAFKNTLLVNLGFEYAYRNYDEQSLKLFRQWLTQKYASIQKLNEIWKVQYKSFDDVTLPTYMPGQTEPNPAKYYDWGDFNLWRFTDYMKWAGNLVRGHLGNMPLTTGGGNPFGEGFWSDGLDEEALGRDVCGVWLSETGSRALGVTSLMDLQRSFDPNKPIIDPEYHALPNTCFLMFLHGCSMMHYWWWPNEVDEFYESSMKHSSTRSLPEVETVMRTALDVRRMAGEISQFRKLPNEWALLYSKPSLIQKYPTAAGTQTPYSMETEKNYAAAVRLDAPVGFISTRQLTDNQFGKLKVIVVPGAYYLGGTEYDKLMQFTKDGGTLIVTPTSMVADEYNRKRNYLKDLGLELTAEELPEMIAGEAKRGVDQPPGEMDFIQGPVAKTIVTKEPKRKVLATADGKASGVPAEMLAQGVLQNVKASADWKVLGAYESGDAAVLVRPLGKGQVYYFAAQLSLSDRKAIYDHVMQAQGISRTIRVLTPDGKYPDGVESRTAPIEGASLTYLHNETSQAQTVQLKSARPLETIFNVSTGAELTDATMTLAPYETRILRIRQ